MASKALIPVENRTCKAYPETKKSVYPNPNALGSACINLLLMLLVQYYSAATTAGVTAGVMNDPDMTADETMVDDMEIMKTGVEMIDIGIEMIGRNQFCFTINFWLHTCTLLLLSGL